MPQTSVTASLTAADRLRRWLPAILVAAGVAAYANSFRGVLLFDDTRAILGNASIRSLRSLGQIVTGSDRPLVNLSLALNYALGGLDPRGYHVVNLLIHLAAGLTLFGLVRRTLRLCRLSGDPSWPAFAAALLWLVHPVQTESVTYIIQRSESLMALAYLLMLYGLARGATDAGHAARWGALAVAACVAGMLSKPVMVTAPLMAWWYDRTFLAGSFRAALTRRRWVYLGLAGAWGVLAVLVARIVGMAGGQAVFSRAASFADALAAQPGVLLWYLRLVAWPHPLCLDYAWPTVQSIRAWLVPGLVIVLGLATTGWAFIRHPTLGFLGAWWFITLAPTSLVPLPDAACEHRLYLPMAAAVVAAVLGARAGLERLIRADHLRRALAAGLVAAVAAGYGLMTWRRNESYADELGMWEQVTVLRPNNARAHANLGLLLQQRGQGERAMAAYTEALRLAPDTAPILSNLGGLLGEQGRLTDAIAYERRALALDPTSAETHNNLANALMQQERFDEAIAHYLEALRFAPHGGPIRENLARAIERARARGLVVRWPGSIPEDFQTPAQGP